LKRGAIMGTYVQVDPGAHLRPVISTSRAFGSMSEEQTHNDGQRFGKVGSSFAGEGGGGEIKNG